MDKNYNIRILDPTELYLVNDLAALTNSLMRNKNYNDLALGDDSVYVGTFDSDGCLIASMTAFRWNVVPFYTIAQYYSKPNTMKLFKWQNNPAVKMAEMLIELMEKENRFTWYYSRSIERWPGRLRIKGNDFFSVSEKCKNYTRYIEEVIPKNTLSAHEAHRRQLPPIPWPYDIIMVKCCLKNDLRSFEYKLEEEYDEN